MLNKRFIIKTVLCYKTQNRFLEVLQMADIFYCKLQLFDQSHLSTPSSFERIQEQINNNISHFSEHVKRESI